MSYNTFTFEKSMSFKSLVSVMLNSFQHLKSTHYETLNQVQGNRAAGFSLRPVEPAFYETLKTNNSRKLSLRAPDGCAAISLQKSRLLRFTRYDNFLILLRRALVRRHSYHFLSLRLVRNPSGFFRKILSSASRPRRPDKRE